MTALTGMNIPASETTPSDSALSAADNAPVQSLFPEDSPVSVSGPIGIAHRIKDQVEAAAQLLIHEEQVDSLYDALNHTQFMLTGESELPEESESETEYIEETESELPEESESETQEWPVALGEILSAESASDDSSGETLPPEDTEAGQPETQAEEPGASDSPEEDGDSTSDSEDAQNETQIDDDTVYAQSAKRGMLTVPDLQNINIARISLYDYRVLRAYPLFTIPKDLHRLYDQVKELVSGFEGDWSVYVQNLSTDQSMVLNDKPLNSASVMKLYIMETVYEAFDNGSMTRDEDMVYLLRDMIINSSNTSSNRLLEILGDGDLAAGIGKVNDFIRSHGYSEETIIYNGFQDPDAKLDPDHQNMVRARDVGLLLSGVYNREFLSRKVCNEIEQMMLEQATRFKIPRGVPEGVDVGNKSGETSDTANDAAVVYSPGGDYILVVLSHGWTDENTANENVVKISQLVYSFFEV